MAALRCWEAQAAAGPVRPLHVVSFENDLDSLRLALRHKSRFPYLRHSAPDAIAATSTRFSVRGDREGGIRGP